MTSCSPFSLPFGCNGRSMKQLISSRSELEAKVGSILEDESKKRREVLERRPSYRKILNDLSSAEVSQIVSQFQQPDIKHDPEHHPAQQHHQHQQHSPNNSSAASSGNNNSSQQSPHQQATITVAASPYLKVVPASTIQLAGPGAGSPDGLPGISALAVNPGSAAGGTIVQYHGQDGQPFFVPGMSRHRTRPQACPSTNRFLIFAVFLFSFFALLLVQCAAACLCAPLHCYPALAHHTHIPSLLALPSNTYHVSLPPLDLTFPDSGCRPLLSLSSRFPVSHESQCVPHIRFPSRR